MKQKFQSFITYIAIREIVSRSSYKTCKIRYIKIFDVLNFRFAEDSSIFSIYSKAFVITCITARVKIFLQNIKLNFRLEKIARYFPEREKN